MVKRKIGILLLLICFCTGFFPRHAQAITVEDAQEKIDPEKTCSLTMSYCYDGVAFSDATVKLYKIADVSADCHYTLTSAFSGSALIINGIRSQGEWDGIRTTLEAYIIAHHIPADHTTATDPDGQASFEALETGLYLAVVGEVAQGDLRCYFASALVALPGLNEDGYWQYQVEVHAKAAALPPVDPEETIDLKVLKLWKGDEGRNDRPKSVEIEIFRNGVSYKTVTLSQENNWCYNWSAKDEGASWMVMERNIPAGYMMMVEERGSSFVVTNTLNIPEPPVDPPKTGDTFNLLLPILLLGISGSALLLLGIAGKRKDK